MHRTVCYQPRMNLRCGSKKMSCIRIPGWTRRCFTERCNVMARTLQEWQGQIKVFNEERLWGNPRCIKDLLLNITEEVGEAWNVIKWVSEEKSLELTQKQKVEWADFIGQVQYLVLKLAYLTNVNTEVALQATMQEFEGRFPIHKVKGHHSNIAAGGFDGKYLRE